MNRRQSSFAYAALLLGVIAFASSFVRPTSGQQGAPSPASVGRYHLTTAGNSDRVYLTDTVTGQTWSYARAREWFDMGSPASPRTP